MRNFLFLLFLLVLTSCLSPAKKLASNEGRPNITIAFGSCSNENKPQIMWDEVLAEQPDYWIWLGDNIYGDSENMDTLRMKYNLQKQNANYQKLIQTSKVLATWDDHDYGVNDGGKEYPMKKESQQVFLDFIDAPADDSRRSQEGIYTCYTHESEIARVKIILLDTRYHRDEIKRVDGVYQRNKKGTILGEDQWTWLANELDTSTADVHIIASGIQVIPREHAWEKWDNFPNERGRLLDLLIEHEIKNPIFITGDRHIGEISQLEWKEKTIYDVTSSSLTHGWSERRKESNRHRKGEIVYDTNYGVIQISRNKDLSVLAAVKTSDRKIAEAIKVD